MSERIVKVKMNIEPKPMRMKHNYIDKKKFHVELTAYRVRAIEAEKNNEEIPIITDYIARCLLLICKNMAKRPNFSNYSYIEDMVYDAVENCLTAVNNFNPDESKQNPFGYFSRIAWNAFIRRIQKEKKQNYIKHKFYHETGLHNDLAVSADSNTLGGVINNDVSNRIIENFENTLNTKKPKKEDKKGIEKFIEE